ELHPYPSLPLKYPPVEPAADAAEHRSGGGIERAEVAGIAESVGDAHEGIQGRIGVDQGGRAGEIEPIRRARDIVVALRSAHGLDWLRRFRGFGGGKHRRLDLLDALALVE